MGMIAWKVAAKLALAFTLSAGAMSYTVAPDASMPGASSSGSESSQTQQPTNQSISIDGSSTVYPFADEAAREYQFEREEVAEFTVAFSGTTGGFRKFCTGETDISKLKAVAIDGGEGPVVPSNEAVVSNQYQPLARPLFIYVNARSLQEKPALRDFVEYYLTHARTLAIAVGYIPLADETYPIVQQHLLENRIGTAFGGKSQTNLTLDELLQTEKLF